MEPVEPSQSQPQEGRDPISRDPVENLRSMMGRRPKGTSSGKTSLGLWRLAAILSLIVNVLFLLFIFAVGRRLFLLKTDVAEPLLENVSAFVNQVEGTTIQTDVKVTGQVPVVFDLPLQQTTTVTLSEDTRIDGASLSIRSATLSIDAPASMTVPAGSQLPVTIDLIVPVNTTVPVELTVPVTLSLADSKISPSFEALQKLVEPYQALAEEAPDCWQNLLWGGNCPPPSE
jgi:hypothetical protein